MKSPRGNTFFYLKSTTDNKISNGLFIFENALKYHNYFRRPGQVVHDILVPRQWHHLCVAINGSKTIMNIIVSSFCKFGKKSLVSLQSYDRMEM